MKFGRLTCVILSVIILAPMLAACTGAREVDDWAYVYSMGIDKGVSDNLRMTVQISTLKTSGGPGGQGGQQMEGSNFTVITLDCPTFYSGVNMINASLSRRINYTQTKYFICSEELARQDIGLLMSAFIRDRQIRRTMHMIIVKGEASEFIKAFNPVVGTSVSKTQEGMMTMQDFNGFIIDTQIGNFTDDIKSTKSQPVAVLAAINDFSALNKPATVSQTFKTVGDYYAGQLPREGGNKTEYIGAALFNGGKFIGELNGDETRCLLMVQGMLKKASYAFPDPLDSQPYTVEISPQKKPEIKVTFSDQKAYIHVKILLEGDLLAIRSDIDFESPDLKPLLEKQTIKYIKEELDGTIKKCQDLNCDAFAFGEIACRQFATIQDWNSYQWLTRFKDTVITTDVSFILRRTGTMIKTNEIKSNEGKSR